jgi:hypothetical protein
MGRWNTMAAVVLLALGSLGCDSESCYLYYAGNGLLFGRTIELDGDAPRDERWRLCLNDDCYALLVESEGWVSLPPLRGDKWDTTFGMRISRESDGRFRLSGYFTFGEGGYSPGDDVRVELIGVLTSGKRLRVPARTVHFEEVGSCHAETRETWI